MKNISNFTDGQKKKPSALIFLIIVLAGVTAGSFIRTGSSSALQFLNDFVPSRCGNTVYEVFINSFIRLSAFTVTAFVLGIWAFGQPFGVLMLVYRGLEIGSSTALIYSSRGLSGLPEVLVLVLPKALAVTAVSVLAVRELMRSSCGILKYVLSDCTESTGRGTFRLYCIKFAVLMIISLIISVGDAFMNYLFSSLR